MKRRNLKTLIACRRGNIAISTALVVPLVIAGAGFGLETGFWYHNESQLQQAADKAAYAAAVAMRAGDSTAEVNAAATLSVSDNGFSGLTPVVTTPPTSGAYAGNANAISVRLDNDVQRYFTKVFSDEETVAESATAVALMQNGDHACVLALSTTASRAVEFGGSTDATYNGCTVMSNSLANDAVYVGGSANMTAECLIAVGGADVGNGANMTGCDEPVTSAPPVGDPFADVPVPANGITRTSTSGSPLEPGNYTNGFTLSGTKTLQPGTYVISGGSFRINANANITGTGVTIYIKSGVDVHFNGNATMNFSAPTSGPYSGMLFFGERSSTGTVTLNGTASSLLTGAIYFAGRDVRYLGNFSGSGGCTQVVANTILWSGNSTVNQDCSAFGMSSIQSGLTVKLVE